MYNKGNDVYLSKTLTWILRHGAHKEGFTISSDGYVPVSQILAYKQLKGKFNVNDIIKVVENNNKQRFTLIKSDSGELKIKANQGHSIGVVKELDLTPITDCCGVENVIHGTYLRNWDKIKREGLSRMTREHIHFTESIDKNKCISGVRGNVEILIYIDLKKALDSGFKFYLSPNKVILSPGDINGLISSEFFFKVVNIIENINLSY
ncbi:tRNA 2'-phosphotransferase 1-like isoform X2 [Onthophagus taurus]|uniref:tRNA 2'-phosphotransferase 1-like isoform X2 n=1 Tax=Onthophagus taurus TaxID=166361 RepID=UPI0039BEB59E